MKEYKREYPLFSLCGLNCGLCPQYHTNAASKCPGCGGPDFHLKHPSCPVINCSKKHENPEYCFQCAAFPCEKYKAPSKTDSFISYQNVLADFQKAQKDGVEAYQNELNEKVEILKFLLENYNDGRRKSFFCLAVNLLDLNDLKECLEEMKKRIEKQQLGDKDKTAEIVSLLSEKAKNRNLILKLRKEK